MPGGGTRDTSDDQGELRTTCRPSDPSAPSDRDHSARRALRRLDRQPRRRGRRIRRAPTPKARSTLPDGTVLPTAAIEAPASVGDSVVPRRQRSPPARPATSRRPRSSAYQRAEAVINEADKGCDLPWELIAAIGRVESDHGRFGGNALDDRRASPVPASTASRSTARTTPSGSLDTDAGQYDDDTRFDRAVGPMQFIPSTWSVVGVDGDSDGTRNPQDVDDAALATAVYLCSGDDDLSAEKGQRASVYRYNHSNDYVDLVLSIMQAYMDGDFSAVPTSTLTSGVIVPDPTLLDRRQRRQGRRRGQRRRARAATAATAAKDDDSSPTKDPTPTQTPTPEPDPDAEPHPHPGPDPVADPGPHQGPDQGPDGRAHGRPDDAAADAHADAADQTPSPPP